MPTIVELVTIKSCCAIRFNLHPCFHRNLFYSTPGMKRNSQAPCLHKLLFQQKEKKVTYFRIWRRKLCKFILHARHESKQFKFKGLESAWYSDYAWINMWFMNIATGNITFSSDKYRSTRPNLRDPIPIPIPKLKHRYSDGLQTLWTNEKFYTEAHLLILLNPNHLSCILKEAAPMAKK